MAAVSSGVFHLHFLEHEDEAQMTGYDFEVSGDKVIVKTTFNFPEYEDMAEPKVMSKPEARALWKKLVDSGAFVPVK